MSEHGSEGGAHGEGVEQHGGKVVAMLEVLDNYAHMIVATFFILMATTVIVHMGFIFARQIPLIPPGPEPATLTAPIPTRPIPQEMAPKPAAMPGKPEAATATAPMLAPSAAIAPAEAAPAAEEPAPEDPFVKNSLELLSLILFVVILLELLRTIITYLQTHDIQAIMQEFLVVGIISSVRKILLVGAESSLVGSKGMDFVLEATGVVIDIIGILLLIGGLLMLKSAFHGKQAAKEPEESAHG